MKKRSILKSIVTSAVALAVVMTTALSAVPTYAASTTITIKAGDQDGIGEATRFTAYQIFKGTPSREPDETTNRDYKINVTDWGDDVNGSNLYTAVTTNPTFQSAFNTWNTSGGKNKTDEFTQPVALAQFLASEQFKGITDGGDEFAKLVFANKKTSGTSSSRPDGDNGNWEIHVPVDGYYLVVDTYTSGGDEPDGSVSSYILQVIGEIEVDLKATIPTVEKKVEGHMGYLSGSETDVNFTLTGTLPMNYDTYDEFKYTFTDTVSKGLTVSEESIKVQLVDGGGPGTDFEKEDDYTVSLTKTEGSENTLTITFTDLMSTTLESQITADSKIVVTYTAKLNKDATASTTGNNNSVKITYSNDPYEEGTGTSVPAEVKTYTLALDVTKNDEKGSPLEGAQFKISKEDGGTKWAKITDGIVTEWVDDETNGTAIEATGGKFNVKGLDSDTYTIHETTTPAGYETMKDVEIVLTATVDNEGTASNSLTVTTPSSDREDVEFSVYGEDGLPVTFTNYPAPLLPHTGGIGRAIVIGISTLVVLFGGAVVLLSTRKKNNK